MNLLRSVQCFLLPVHFFLFLALEMLNEMELPLLLMLSRLTEILSESLVLVRVDFVGSVGSQLGIERLFLAELKKLRRVDLIDLLFHFFPELLLPLNVLHPEPIQQVVVTAAVHFLKLLDSLMLVMDKIIESLIFSVLPILKLLLLNPFHKYLFVIDNLRNQPLHNLPVLVSFLDIPIVSLAHLPLVELLQQRDQNLDLPLLTDLAPHSKHIPQLISTVDLQQIPDNGLILLVDHFDVPVKKNQPIPAGFCHRLDHIEQLVLVRESAVGQDPVLGYFGFKELVGLGRRQGGQQLLH